MGQGQRPDAFGELGPLASHARFAERSARKLARSIFYGMARWQAGLEKHQAFLGRIVDIGSELFVIAATCAYAQTVGREHPERQGADSRHQSKQRPQYPYAHFLINDAYFMVKFPKRNRENIAG